MTDKTGDIRRTHEPASKPAGIDQDLHKGATEVDRPGGERSSHPGLDENGMPNDPTAIAQDRVGSHDDESQG